MFAGTAVLAYRVLLLLVRCCLMLSYSAVAAPGTTGSVRVVNGTAVSFHSTTTAAVWGRTINSEAIVIVLFSRGGSMPAGRS